MARSKILADLDSLIKRASSDKQAEIKAAADVSAKLDSMDDGTSPASTGAQAAAQITAQKEQYPSNTVDNGAKDNTSGASVDKSTDGATAVDTSGQHGTTGGELASGGISQADNGPKDTDSPDNNGFNSGAFKTAAAEARALAADLRKTASELLTPFDRFLVKAARSGNAELKKHAEAMDDMELADAAGGNLEEQLASGQLSEEDALAILEEALASGAITEEELAQAAQGMGAEGMPPEGMPAEAGMLPPEAAAMPPEGDMMEAKLAAAHIGPEHPDYMNKLASLYQPDILSGYTFAMKLAEELSAEEEEEEEEEEEGAEIEIEKPMEDATTPNGADEEAALQAVAQELGLDPAMIAELMAAPVPEATGAEINKIASALKQAGVDNTYRFRTIVMHKVAALRQ